MNIVFALLIVFCLNQFVIWNGYCDETQDQSSGEFAGESSVGVIGAIKAESLKPVEEEPPIDSLIEYTFESAVESTIESKEALPIEPSKDVVEETVDEPLKPEPVRSLDEIDRKRQYSRIERTILQKIGEAGVLQARLLIYREKIFGLNSVETLQPIEALAWLYMQQNFYRDAELLYKRAIKIRKEKVPRSRENIKQIGIDYFMLGDAYLYRQLYYRAEASFDESMSYARDSGHKGDVHSRKGIIYEGLENKERAVSFYLEAEREYRAEKLSKPLIKKHLNKRLLYAYNALIRIYTDMNDEEKIEKYQRLIEDIKKEEAGIVF